MLNFNCYNKNMKNIKEILLSADPVGELRELIANNTLRSVEPTLANLKMDIPRGYQHKDNLEHSLRVLQNAIDRENGTPDLVLRASALFHDIGKPGTRQFDSRKNVTFDGHEMLGAKIVRKVLPGHGFNKAEVKEIALIVALHMRSHGFGDVDWTDSAVRRLVTDAGNPETLRRLVIVFYADTTTKNNPMLKSIHNAIDKLSVTIDRVVREDARRAMRPALNGNEVMELFGLKPGKELGVIMKFLNSDEGIKLTRNEAIAVINYDFLS